ncbi:glycerophosphoryl diester phosphodiesterase membrane domain-containing protein [Caulobacter endophyticus]|uniref:glycerophosphoryl diester phosphodiesterase membrane domain-containing protein n=1 Tax=Caulobacter endophyticus TaxID=2172652 RepID=UPI002410651E|nr:glycerophosphoryl diester phosphodiesterase membrane domain-containing protein [Caulobacter endophyticus]MDG2527827.1 glycerophosphoryl diester phosphodiesterase membrane domain-containing protein [Caulobacter endophyticus]
MTTQEPVGGTFDFGRVIQRTFTVITANAMLFGVGALVLVSAPVLLGALIGLPSLGDPRYIGWIAAGSILSVIGNLVLQGMVARAAVGTLNGASVAPGEAFSSGLRVLLPLIGLAIVSALGIWLGFLLLIVPGIIVSIMWSVAAPSLVVEKKGVFASLQRSRDLTRGHRWAIFGLFIVYMILSLILSVVTQAIGAPLGVASGNMFGIQGLNMSAGLIVFVVVSAVMNGVQAVVGSAGVAALYYELRTTKEGAAPDETAAIFD